MGTIDISYYNLFIGLLLLAIPFFYLWKFKTGLLKPAVIGTLRMIIQLFFIGMYLKYLFLWAYYSELCFVRQDWDEITRISTFYDVPFPFPVWCLTLALLLAGYLAGKRLFLRKEI